MRIMPALSILPLVAPLLLLGACSGAPSPNQRTATDLNPSGRPYNGPPGRLASYPADTNLNPLFCHPEPPGTVCERSH